VVWHFIFEFLHLHDSKRMTSRRGEIADVIKAAMLGTVSIALAAILFRISLITSIFLLAFFGISTTAAIAVRVAVRSWLASIRRAGRNRRYMLIMGTNKRALQFAHKVESRPDLGYQMIGFADNPTAVSNEFRSSEYQLVSDLDGLPNFLRSNVVDEVVMALPIRSFHEHASAIAIVCEEQGILLRSLSDLFETRIVRRKTEEFEGDYVITYYNGVLTDGWGVIMKRVVDCFGSFILLLLLAPVFLVIAVAIKLSSSGPVFFVQQRLGLSKRKFFMYKFRTMVRDAEQMFNQVEHLNEVTGPVFKIKNDPRVTSIGRILRKTSFDELPQLFNVLRGDMSLVGPRPLDVRDYELMAQSCPDWQRCRFSVRPGITCLWQVNGRNSLPFEQWMEMDRQYIQNWSLWLDLQILFRTIPVVLKRSGV
jgi:exopolysaccharide biosynthesis polyprenyl glycosylphosphotransferase